MKPVQNARFLESAVAPDYKKQILTSIQEQNNTIENIGHFLGENKD